MQRGISFDAVSAGSLTFCASHLSCSASFRLIRLPHPFRVRSALTESFARFLPLACNDGRSCALLETLQADRCEEETASCNAPLLANPFA